MSSKEAIDNSSSQYLELFRDNIKRLPILGYIYFEALSQYILYHQNDGISEKYRKVNELYNWHYKDLMFHFHPDFLGRFELGNFNPDEKAIVDYLSSNKIVNGVDSADFTKSLVRALVDLTFDSILCNIRAVRDLKLPRQLSLFNDLPTPLIPLAGHILHREIRKYERYSDFYFFFDQIKALEVWNYWNKMGIVVPFNGVIPKGEMGINPAYVDKVCYQFYECEGLVESNDFYYVKKGKPLDVQIIPRLVDYKCSFMRARNNSRYE
jgi:hypothetical protein